MKSWIPKYVSGYVCIYIYIFIDMPSVIKCNNKHDFEVCSRYVILELQKDFRTITFIGNS